MQHSRLMPHAIRPTMRASFDHFFDSTEAAWAPAMSPCCSSVFTFEALMMAGIANGQNRKIETIDIVMLLSTAGCPGCAMRVLLVRGARTIGTLARTVNAAQYMLGYCLGVSGRSAWR